MTQHVWRLSGGILTGIITIVFALGIVINPAFSSEATIVGVYENCKFVTSTVFVNGDDMSTQDAQQIAVEAEMSRLQTDNFDQSIPPVVDALKRHGIKSITLDRQGFAGCGNPGTGKFVEAIATYCGAKLINAEIKIDRETFSSRKNPESSFDAFVQTSLRDLHRAGIWDPLRIVVNSEGECE
ncbi:MAG: hypothetical protein OER96_01755 [Gammaproteobacteria bacterium]|nr:hypothetical protein [Gammaproteobacteria bacterium]